MAMSTGMGSLVRRSAPLTAPPPPALPPQRAQPPKPVYVNTTNTNPSVANVELPTNIKLLSGKETSEFLRADRDGYVSRMTRMDFVARGMHPDVYIKTIAETALRTAPLSSIEQKKLFDCIQKADAFFYRCVRTPIDGTVVARMPWNIAFVSGQVYEHGLPHTRDDVIFLSTDILSVPAEELARTLVHEKVHIFQRANIEAMEMWLAENNYEAFDRIANRDFESDFRSNPDIGDWYYMKCKRPAPYARPSETDANAEELNLKRQNWLMDNCKPMVAIYENKGKDPEGNDVPMDPENITQIRKGTGGEHEHPYEKMAYDIAKRYTSSKCKPI